MPPVQAPALILPASPVDVEVETRRRAATRAARPRKAPGPYPLPDGDWQERGVCRTANPSLFFAPDHENNHQRRFRETAAKAICAHCPVRAVCRSYALQTGELYGIWGGTTERERERMRGARTAARRPTGPSGIKLPTDWNDGEPRARTEGHEGASA